MTLKWILIFNKLVVKLCFSWEVFDKTLIKPAFVFRKNLLLMILTLSKVYLKTIWISSAISELKKSIWEKLNKSQF